MQNGCVLFARWQNVSTLRSASSSAQESRRCAWSSGSSGRVVPVARGSVVPTVLWFLSSSCFPRIPFQNWIRVAFHTGRDRWTHVLSCRGNREAISIAGRHLSLQFEFQGSVPGKGGLVEESESQDPSRDGISVFSLNSRVLSWGMGRRTEPIAQCMSGIGRSLACVGLSKRLGMYLPVVLSSCRVSSPAGCAGARTISELSSLSQHGSRPVQLRACPVLDLPLPSRDRILQMST